MFNLEEIVKSRALPVAVAVAVICSILAVSAGVNTGELQSKFTDEQYRRLSTEKLLQESQAMISRLQMEVEASRRKIASIEQVLNEGKTQASDLEAQVGELQEQKAALEEQLQQTASQSTDQPQAKPDDR